MVRMKSEKAKVGRNTVSRAFSSLPSPGRGLSVLSGSDKIKYEHIKLSKSILHTLLNPIKYCINKIYKKDSYCQQIMSAMTFIFIFTPIYLVLRRGSFAPFSIMCACSKNIDFSKIKFLFLSLRNEVAISWHSSCEKLNTISQSI